MRASVLDALASGAVFATLLGPLPRPSLPSGAAARDVVRAMIRAQVSVGLEPVTDGADARLSDAPSAWREAQDIVLELGLDVAVKQAVVGPYTLARQEPGSTLAECGQRVGAVVAALLEIGCPLVEVHEPALVGRQFDEAERVAVVDSWRSLFGGGSAAPGHIALAVVGGDVTGFGPALYDPPFASYAFDLRKGPDNWRVIADAPGSRGIVAGALSTAADSDDGPELLAWAAHYAASMRGRGLDRVGLATAGSLGALSWDAALAKLAKVARAAEVAALRSFAEMAPHFDPRAASMKSAAFGRHVKPVRRPRDRGS